MSGPTHHPDETQLLAYAIGQASPPLALILATHLSLCGACRQTVGQLEAVGGALLHTIEPAAVSPGLLAATLAKLDHVQSPDPRRAAASTLLIDLPAPLRDAIGKPLDQLSWRRYGRNIAETVLMREEGGFQASLLRIKAGGAIPTHTHHGTEITLLLRGAFVDGGDVYRRGDLAVTDGSVKHRPAAIGTEDCLCLVATEAPPRFTGLFGPVLNYVARW